MSLNTNTCQCDKYTDLLTVFKAHLSKDLNSLHLDQHKKSYNNYPKEVTADAGYGSEENYDYLEENKIKGFVKYSLFDKQQKGSNQTKTPFRVDKLFYNKEQDCYICPMGQPMSCLGTFKIQNASGSEQEVKNIKQQIALIVH